MVAKVMAVVMKVVKVVKVLKAAGAPPLQAAKAAGLPPLLVAKAAGDPPLLAAKGDEETSPEAEVGSTEPTRTTAAGARKGGEEPERAEGGALEVDPLPDVQRGQETGPRPTTEGPVSVAVTEGAQEEPPKEQPPRASFSGSDEGSGPCVAVVGETAPEAVSVTTAEGGEGPERVDPLPWRNEDGPETVPRPSKEGPKAATRQSGLAVYVERPSAPPKSRQRGPQPSHCHRGGEGSIPEAVRGSAEEAEPMEEAPAERQKGREEPERADGALRVGPLPVTKETSETGPDSTIEGPAAEEVAEVAQEGPLKEQLPRASTSSDSDTGPEPCVAEEGAAEPAPEAEAGSADKAEPMQATPAEGPEGEKEPPLPEQELPRASASCEEADSTPEASVGSADNADPMQATLAEGPEVGEEPLLSEQELASLSCGDGGSGPRAAAEGDAETSPEAEVGSTEPTRTTAAGVQTGGEEPERAEGGALEVDPLPDVQRGQETGPRPTTEGPVSVAVTEGAQEEPPKEQPPRASFSGSDEGSGPCVAVVGETAPEAVSVTTAEGGEGPERVDPLPWRNEDGPETVPRPSKEGPKAATRQSGLAMYVERPSAPPKSRVQTVPARVPPPVSPAASPGGGALGDSVKIKTRRNALTHQRECIVLLHREGGGGELEEREEDSESMCSVGSESLRTLNAMQWYDNGYKQRGYQQLLWYEQHQKDTP
ncbi:UNVERIFIED_CONTAM: hypothetical protein FKN15_031954 [Acipenser sinensis]